MLRTKFLVKYNIVQRKDAILSFWLISPKSFILMGQSKITKEKSLIIYRMFWSKWIARLIKSIKFTEPGEENHNPTYIGVLFTTENLLIFNLI